MSRRKWIYQWYVSTSHSWWLPTDGSLGGMIDYPTGRILRDARLYTVGAGTQEIRRMLIGREFNEEILGRS